MTELSPVELYQGLHIKREDLYRKPNGANGSKLRAAEHLLKAAYDKGFRKVVTAAATVSPQHALVATAARDLGMTTHHIVGGTKESTLFRHSSPRLALETGVADFEIIGVGYNPALVAAARRHTEENADTYWLHYGISAPPESSAEELRAFHGPSAAQTANIPGEVTELVLPFGSGNTGAGVLMGLADMGWDGQVHVMAIGPDRQRWLRGRLMDVGWNPDDLPFQIVHRALHPGFATYGDRMPETLHGIVLHPTYEGKVVRWLNMIGPKYWEKPGGRTMMWVVGSAIPRLPGSSS